VSLVAFVINRALLRDPRRFAQRCRAAAEDRGWEPWFAPDPVAGSPALTRLAVEAGADLVVAAGGDGTVRACAEALAGTGIPLAIVPLGTANLVARALGVPGQAGRAFAVAFGGRDRPVDLGLVTGAGGPGMGPDGGAGPEGGTGVVFAAMAGIGLDAAVVGAAWPWVKRRVGWVAYGMAAVPRLGWPASDFTIQVDGAAPVRRRARCVVVANAGLLPGGFTLLPAARLDDGLLDVGILAPAGGWDWLRLGGKVLGGKVLDGRLPGGRVLGEWVLGAPSRGLAGERGRLVEVSTDRVLPRQADGEVLVPGQTLGASVAPGALVLRLAKWGGTG
jgi:diacylglycerol kinase family enzyme